MRDSDELEELKAKLAATRAVTHPPLPSFIRLKFGPERIRIYGPNGSGRNYESDNDDRTEQIRALLEAVYEDAELVP